MAEEVDFRGLVAATEGYSGADLKVVCRDAAMMPMRRLLAQTTDPTEIRALKEAGGLDVRCGARNTIVPLSHRVVGLRLGLGLGLGSGLESGLGLGLGLGLG